MARPDVHDVGMVDMVNPDAVSIEMVDGPTGLKLWVNVDGKCVCRIGMIPCFVTVDVPGYHGSHLSKSVREKLNADQQD